MISISTGFDFEEQIASRGHDADDVLKRIDFFSYFSLQEKRLPDNKAGILETLANDDLITKSWESRNILNIGVILFARELQSFKGLMRKFIRLITSKSPV